MLCVDTVIVYLRNTKITANFLNKLHLKRVSLLKDEVSTKKYLCTLFYLFSRFYDGLFGISRGFISTIITR